MFEMSSFTNSNASVRHMNIARLPSFTPQMPTEKKTASRLPENSRNSFVHLRSQKDSNRNRPKKLFQMLYFDLKYV